MSKKHTVTESLWKDGKQGKRRRNGSQRGSKEGEGTGMVDVEKREGDLHEAIKPVPDT